jgi:hypothetical protein
VRRATLLFLLAIAAIAVAPGLTAPASAATSVAARYQLRGHLPELGERPAMRVFATPAAYDAYRASLGEANVFPPSGSLFMSFDREILALYIRGNDSGGRCFGTTPAASLDGERITLGLSWQSGTCGAPISAHYPFILVALSRTAADGTAWVSPNRSVCGSAPDVASSSACATISGSATSAPTATTAPAPTATAVPSPTASPPPTATRSLTPSVPAATSPVAAASPTRTAALTVTPTRSPVAAASPPPAGDETGMNYLLYGMLIAIGFLVGIALMLSRGSRSRRVP